MKKLPLKHQQTHGLAIKQDRSKLTYDKLISTGFLMLEQHDLQDISIADLTREAGYSVGAFYSRFRSKDEFFDALIAKHLEVRDGIQTHLFTTLPTETLLLEVVSDVVNYYWDRRKFWRAVLVRSVRDTVFWEPIQQHGYKFRARFIARIHHESGKTLTAQEESNISFAFQILIGTINSTILNQNGPIFMGQQLFIEELTRAFQLVSDFNSLIKTK